MRIDEIDCANLKRYTPAILAYLGSPLSIVNAALTFIDAIS